MKKILMLVTALLVWANLANAQTVTDDLVGLGMKAEQAEYLASILPAGAVLGNGVYLKARNQANSADISILRVDTTDDTVLNADTGDVVKLAVAGSAHVTLDGTNLKYFPAGDSNRLYTFGASSDTAHALTFGDGGTTAAQVLTLSASTSDADDDSAVIVTAGGAYNSGGSRGSYLNLRGNEEATNPGMVELVAGAAAGDGRIQLITKANASINMLPNNANGVNITTGGNVVAYGFYTTPAANYESVAAAGNAQGNAQALAAKALHYVTAADGTKGVILPAVVAANVGQRHDILTSAAAVLKIYPETGGTVNGAAANAAFSTATGPATVVCYVTAAATWVCS